MMIDQMNTIVLFLSFSVMLFAIAFALYERHRTKQIMKHLSDMLDSAMKGHFTEQVIDESRLSALETKFAHYLSHSEHSSHQVNSEKERIEALIADISHQTKTPIANLLLYTELLQEEALSPDAKANAQAIFLQAEKLRFLIASLVKLSRLENGIIAPSPKSESVQGMLERLYREYEPKANAKNLTLRLSNGHATAVFDAKWTAEAIGNLLDNAIKYTQSGEITISSVSYELFTRIDITDSGSGISEEEQAKIFSHFYRSQQHQATEGVGIGLYLTRQIIAGQGGYIKITSTLGKGSTFSVFLPRTLRQ